jgi:hypothetical protein
MLYFIEEERDSKTRASAGPGPGVLLLFGFSSEDIIEYKRIYTPTTAKNCEVAENAREPEAWTTVSRSVHCRADHGASAASSRFTGKKRVT